MLSIFIWWQLTFDAKVTACDETAALSQSAYVLFYAREGAWEGGAGTLIPSAQRFVWAAKQPLGSAALHCHPRASSAKTRGFHTQLDEGPETP